MSDNIIQYIGKFLIVLGIIIIVIEAMLLIFWNRRYSCTEKEFYFLFPAYNKYSLEHYIKSDPVFLW